MSEPIVVYWCEKHQCASTDPKWCVISVHPIEPGETVLMKMLLVPAPVGDN